MLKLTLVLLCLFALYCLASAKRSKKFRSSKQGKYDSAKKSCEKYPGKKSFKVDKVSFHRDHPNKYICVFKNDAKEQFYVIGNIDGNDFILNESKHTEEIPLAYRS